MYFLFCIRKNGMVQFIKAEKKHYDAILHLLKENKLPISDLDEAKFKHFIVAEESHEIIGCVGLEIYSSDALLRSLSVKPVLQSKGLGSQLYDKIIDYARSIGVRNVHLLTTTAEKFFLKKGFVVDRREKAPEPILNTDEFKTICGSTSVYMRLNNIYNRAHLIPT
jgi:amino-acid N-acetyltransferase